MDYILASDNLRNIASNIKVEIGPHVEINSDHDYPQLDMYFEKNRKSRDERRKHYRFPDYLLIN